MSAEKREEHEEIEIIKTSATADEDKENLPPQAKKLSLELPKVNRLYNERLMMPLASCLKVRYMFDVTKQTDPRGVNQIKKTVLELCHNSVIHHIGVDTVSEEGLVFVKTASLEDAGKAAKHLNEVATAKYLLLEKYCERFHEERLSNIPMTVRILRQPCQDASPRSQLSREASQGQLTPKASLTLCQQTPARSTQLSQQQQSYYHPIT